MDHSSRYRHAGVLLAMLASPAFGADVTGPVFGNPIPLRTDSGTLRLQGSAHVLVVDWDRDGRLDFLISGTSGGVTVARNLGGSGIETRFAPQEAVCQPPGYDFTSCLWDMDGDGDLDLLCEDRRSVIYQFENVGTRAAPKMDARGVLRDAEGIPFSVAFRYPGGRPRDSMNGYIDPRFCHWTAQWVCDWYGDGGQDLLIGDETGVIWVLADESHGKGAPTYRAEHYRKTGSGPWQDLIATYGETFATPEKCLRDRDGVVIRLGQHDPKDPVFFGAFVKPAVCDWDGDGDQDIIASAGVYSGLTYWLENVSNNPQAEPVLIVRGPLSTVDGQKIVPTFSGMEYPCDWDGDGDMDLIGAAGDATGAGFYENTRNGPGEPQLVGRGNFSEKDALLLANEVASCVDWDGDGLNDFIESSWSGSVGCRRNTGRPDQPRFNREVDWFRDQNGPIRVPGETDPTAREAGGFTRGIACDWNRDGIPDLLVGADTGHIWYLRGLAKEPGEARRAHFYNEGRLQTASGKLIKVHNRVSPAVLDVDGDGDQDLLAAGSSYQLGVQTDPTPGGDVQFFETTGASPRGEPILADPVVWTVDGKPFTVGINQNFVLSAGDVDGDGVAELALWPVAGAMRLVRNLGSPGKPDWRLGAELPGGFSFGYLGDLNGDGFADGINGGGEGRNGEYRLNLTRRP